MARERIKTNDGGTAVEDAPEIGEQEMLPGCADLDMRNAKHKAAYQSAKRLKKKDADWKASKGTLKEIRDAEEQKLIGLMHEAGLSKFDHKGVKAKLNQGKETATVEVDSDDEADDSSDDE